MDEEDLKTELGWGLESPISTPAPAHMSLLKAGGDTSPYKYAQL
jgi:hypothetical protein